MPSIDIERFAKRVPSDGDKRRLRCSFDKGYSFYYVQGSIHTQGSVQGTFVLTSPASMEVTQRYYSNGRWTVIDHHFDTLEPVYTRWMRFKNWLFRRNPLPEARLLP